VLIYIPSGTLMRPRSSVFATVADSTKFYKALARQVPQFGAGSAAIVDRMPTHKISPNSAVLRM
jgi:hypothetical protein